MCRGGIGVERGLFPEEIKIVNQLDIITIHIWLLNLLLLSPKITTNYGKFNEIRFFGSKVWNKMQGETFKTFEFL